MTISWWSFTRHRGIAMQGTGRLSKRTLLLRIVAPGRVKRGASPIRTCRVGEVLARGIRLLSVVDGSLELP